MVNYPTHWGERDTYVAPWRIMMYYAHTLGRLHYCIWKWCVYIYIYTYHMYIVNYKYIGNYIYICTIYIVVKWSTMFLPCRCIRFYVPHLSRSLNLLDSLETLYPTNWCPPSLEIHHEFPPVVGQTIVPSPQSLEQLDQSPIPGSSGAKRGAKRRENT